ncbi:MAG TPA: hypothetical protein VKT27_03610 [Candidatus Binataceae bacterium]|nr:hypothetical protein [Candidatus Binataceae bacterium]
MAKQRRRAGRARAKRTRRGLLVTIALLVLAAGFITRRVLAPRAMYFLTHRGPLRASEPAADARPGDPPYSAPGEDLTDSDRRALDRVVRQKSGER